MMPVNSEHLQHRIRNWLDPNSTISHRSLHHHSAVALCLFALLVQGCGAATRELEQVNAQQANTETMVKAALIDEQSVNAASIQVSMDEGAIVLSGFVGTQTESDTAERLARLNTQGLPIINLLQLR